MSTWGTRRGVPRHIRVRILERDGWRCQLGLPGCEYHACQIDHIAGVAQLGYANDDDDNLRSVCSSCHRVRSNAQRDAAVRGSARRPGLHADTCQCGHIPGQDM